MRIYRDLFNEIINPESLFVAWQKFRRRKGTKNDVINFEKNLEQHLFQLHRDLKDKTYRHSGYSDFFISDPKSRHIHKASVRDRVLHHAIYQTLVWVFEPIFIRDSFSCRWGKGTHKGVVAVEKMLRKESKNNTRTCYALKCDIKKFFDSVDHDTLLSILQKKIQDPELIWLLEEIIESYPQSEFRRERERGKCPANWNTHW